MLGPQLHRVRVEPAGLFQPARKSVAKEQGQNNIGAKSIVIGVIETDIFLMLRDQRCLQTTGVRLKKMPLQRFSSPAEVARMALFLVCHSYPLTPRGIPRQFVPRVVQ